MNRKFHAAALIGSFALLAACTTPGAPLRGTAGNVPAGTAYLANGHEPGWTVEITAARIAFHHADGAHLMLANPGAQPSFNGERYVTPQLTVDVTHSACNDSMSDRRYTDTVLLEWHGRSLHGCGGTVLPPATLNGTNWRIISIDNAPIVAGRPAELNFAGDRVSGSAGCNRLMGHFTSDGTRLTVGGVASTMMACTDPAVMRQENRLIALLGQSLAIHVTERGRLTLTGNDGATILLEQVM